MFIYYRLEVTLTNFTLDTSLPVHTGDSLEVGLISRNKNSGKGCVWKNEPLLFSQKIELVIFSY